MDSSCTQRILIDVLDLVLLVIYCLVSLVVIFLRRQNGNEKIENIENRTRNWFFVVVSACSAVISIANFIAAAWIAFDDKHEFKHLDWVVYGLRGFIWAGFALSLNIHRTRLVKTIALIWWLSSCLLVSIINIESMVNGDVLSVFDSITWVVSLLLFFSALRLILGKERNSENNTISEHLLVSEDGDNGTMFSNASLWSKLTFSWMNPLMSLGHSKSLDLNDIPPLDSEDDALVAFQAFCHAWHHEKQKNSNKSMKQNLIFFALVRCYMKEMLLIGFYSFLKAISTVALPPLLYALVQYSNNANGDLSLGITLVVCLLVVKVVESLTQRHWFFYSRRCGMRMRSALMAAVFQKQIKLSSLGRTRHSAGEITSYIAVDAYRLGEFPWWFHTAWSLPLQLCFSIALLFWIVGLGALPGLVLLIICAILNVPFGKMLQAYQSNFMVAQDERLRATSEVLNSMKIIKLQSWEEKFRTMIQFLRDIEFKWLGEIQIKKAYGAAIYWISPTVVSAAIFAGSAAMRSAPLNASTIFTILATLRLISQPVRMLPEALSALIQVKVSLDRLDIFLLEDEIEQTNTTRNFIQTADTLSVKIDNGVFSWDSSSVYPTLESIDLNVCRGEKVAIVGSVGAGKSSVLCAILGEIPKLSGSVEVYGSIAYVSQSAWIQSGTIRDNILFGKLMNKKNYEKAIKACALDHDLNTFPYGDLTEIGQRGINLSGGQKQRIQLARAVYNDADIYLLDDPFSAVDAHTAAILFKECVMAALDKKTVILVTHQIDFLNQVDRILVMESGQIKQAGEYEELVRSGMAFEKLVNYHQSAKIVLDPAKPLKSIKKPEEIENQIEVQYEIPIENKGTAQLTEDEETEFGSLGWKPYRDYISVSRGYFLFFTVIFTQTIFTIMQTMSSYWLAIAIQMHNLNESILIGVYTVISALSCLLAFTRSWFAAHLGLKASKEFFCGFMDSVFIAPMLFFDSTPVGRILTRASSDMSIIDFDIPYSMVFALAGWIELLTTVIFLAIVTWQVLIVAIPVMILVVYIQRYYLASARELVRINGTTKAPVTSFAAETLLGVVTIRAYAMDESFISKNMQLINTDAKLFFHTIASMEWVLIRVEALQNLIVLASALSIVLIPQGTIAPGFVGLSLSCSLWLTSIQVFLTRWYSVLENSIISIERIKQYMHIQSEPPAIIDGHRPPHSWPQEGNIEFSELKVQYRRNSPLVLKGITCAFMAGQKIGVVGRTGSGKTTMISALFRLVEPVSGTIFIDGLDICSIGLKDLRMKLSIIPQEPTLFKGSVRTNLDPLGLYTDKDIWEALEKCQLKHTICKLPALLDSSVSDDGENWSTGERQLFCLGRVLLRKNKILVLDEATASVDTATDAILQKIIRQEFSNCTVITVAHRVPTVTDSDRVMVLSYGNIVEFGKPAELLESKESYFSKLVEEYWSK
ncbi:Xenobiotic-transporting ATPase protein [Dioscorea alata]|uniref:Xenobiotic-transporting ATPase protein n=1 Tax=Dioscorea alata TaxID=55571 RepID=A0ACB7UBD7_DIOAL|nr:Xenobiotic-transporting ATPase protein [Dioscorea alata]